MDLAKFNRAHDRYLNPPDPVEGEDELDEMDLASIARQRRIDYEDWQAEKLRQRQEDME